MTVAASDGASGSAADQPAASAAAAATAAGHDEQAQHYEAVAASYESAFFYSSAEYRDWVLGHLVRHMRLPDSDAAIVDLGGGTGNFTQALAEAAGCSRRVLCVDAFAEMLAKARAHPRLEPLLMDAVAYARLPPGQAPRCSHVLLKELVHHIPAEDIPALFSGLAAQLVPGGVAVTVTRPQEVDYPLFARAREIWREHQPHHSLFVGAAEAAGLHVEVHEHAFAAELSKATWLRMMASKFWSTFSHCTPEELAQGIAEVEREHEGRDTVQFTDRLLFLVARKPPAAAAADGAAAGGAAAAAASTAAPQEPALSAAQRGEYGKRGFTGPLTVLSAEEAAAAAERYERYAAQLPGGAVTEDWRFKSHLLLPWVADLVRHPTIVAAVSEALGGCSNLVCWSTDWFDKRPGDGGFTGWHQDSTYVGLDPPDVVTVWLALTPSSAANGALHFLPGSHLAQLPHVDTYSPGNLLLKGQTFQELEGQEGECVPLQPGQATLHHIRLAHRSGPAAAGTPRRLGLALRYMAAHVEQSLQPRDSVTLVAGRDTFGCYRHEAAPAQELGAREREEHRRAVAPVYPAGFERGGGGGSSACGGGQG